LDLINEKLKVVLDFDKYRIRIHKWISNALFIDPYNEEIVLVIFA
jgi:hypothetical protein